MKLRELGESVGNAVLRRVGRASARAQETRGLTADVLESDDAYLVVFDAPGATGSDVQVRYVDGTVEVRVDRFRRFYEDFEMRFPGRGLALDGEASLPDDAVVDPEAATATLTRSGTLEVLVPKAEEVGRGGGTNTVSLTGEEDAAGEDDTSAADEGYTLDDDDTLDGDDVATTDEDDDR